MPACKVAWKQAVRGGNGKEAAHIERDEPYHVPGQTGLCTQEVNVLPFFLGIPKGSTYLYSIYLRPKGVRL